MLARFANVGCHGLLSSVHHASQLRRAGPEPYSLHRVEACGGRRSDSILPGLGLQQVLCHHLQHPRSTTPRYDDAVMIRLCHADPEVSAGSFPGWDANADALRPSAISHTANAMSCTLSHALATVLTVPPDLSPWYRDPDAICLHPVPALFVPRPLATWSLPVSTRPSGSAAWLVSGLEVENAGHENPGQCDPPIGPGHALF